jgi:hypothetical protein
MKGAGLHRHGLRTKGEGFSDRKEDQMLKESTTFSTIRIPSSRRIQHRRNATSLVPARSKKILLYRFMTPPVRTRIPTGPLICLLEVGRTLSASTE